MKVAENQAVGPSRGRPIIKTHILSDISGRLAVVYLTPDNASDVRTAPTVLAAAPGHIRRLPADKDCDADWLRADLRKAGIVPVIPGTRSRERQSRHDKGALQGPLARRVATRYDKLTSNYAPAAALADVIAIWC